MKGRKEGKEGGMKKERKGGDFPQNILIFILSIVFRNLDFLNFLTFSFTALHYETLISTPCDTHMSVWLILV